MTLFEIIDGGLATTLVRNGFENIDSDPLWSARLLRSNPSAIYAAHREFTDNGATILISTSYQASLPGFREHLGLEADQSLKLIRDSVSLARDAARDSLEASATAETHAHCSEACPIRDRRPALVAGSVGPYGACLHDGSEYTGAYADFLSSEELKAWHRPRLAALVAAECDLLAVETVPALKEALAVMEGLKEHPGVKAWVSFSCQDGRSFKDPSKNGTKTHYGDDWADAVVELAEKFGKSLAGVGVNCTAPRSVVPLVESLLRHPKSRKLLDPDLALVMYPNSGESWSLDSGFYGNADEKPFSHFAAEWLKFDWRPIWIGGCCRVFSGDISKLHSLTFK